MGVTSDPNDPRLGRGIDTEPTGMNAAYLVLSDEERAKGFVRPVRRSYVHVGVGGPTHPLRDLTAEEQGRFAQWNYAKFEECTDRDPDDSVTGRFWTQAQLDAARPCGAVTTMGQAIAETYARDPNFYGATFCVRCNLHRPVGEHGEFVWDGVTDDQGQPVKVGT